MKRVKRINLDHLRSPMVAETVIIGCGFVKFVHSLFSIMRGLGKMLLFTPVMPMIRVEMCVGNNLWVLRSIVTMIIMSMGRRMHFMEEMSLFSEQFSSLIRSQRGSELRIIDGSFMLKIVIRKW